MTKTLIRKYGNEYSHTGNQFIIIACACIYTLDALKVANTYICRRIWITRIRILGIFFILGYEDGSQFNQQFCNLTCKHASEEQHSLYNNDSLFPIIETKGTFEWSIMGLLLSKQTYKIIRRNTKEKLTLLCGGDGTVDVWNTPYGIVVFIDGWNATPHSMNSRKTWIFF